MVEEFEKALEVLKVVAAEMMEIQKGKKNPVDIDERFDKMVAAYYMVQDKSQVKGQTTQESFLNESHYDLFLRIHEHLSKLEKGFDFDTRGTEAFNKGEYVEALYFYNKGIGITMDHYKSYINRAETFMKLHYYEKAIKDCETALTFKEDSLGAWLFMAHCYFVLGKYKKSDDCIDEAIKRISEKKHVIKSYQAYFKNKSTS